jgi:hypothetical protein
MTKTRDLANLGSGFTQAGAGAARRTVESKLKDEISVKDFGARGDGLGATPADEGVDISNASWNTWDGTPFKNNLAWSPYGTTGSFVPPTPKPFQNTDTWDFIGVQLALWQSTRSVYIPEGDYVINVSRTAGGLIMMKDQEKTIRGASTYFTRFVTKEDANFFVTGNQADSHYNILTLYRTGGPPTHILGVGFIGPSNFPTDRNNLSLINMLNVNGITVREVWLSSASYGIKTGTYSGEVLLKGITAEFCFNSTVFSDSDSETYIDFCNIVASASLNTQRGVVIQGYGQITNSRFSGFDGQSVILEKGIFSNNEVTNFSQAGGVTLNNFCIANNNFIAGDPAGPLVNLTHDCTFVGNRLDNTGSSSCVNLGDGNTAGSATNIILSGNLLKSTAGQIPISGFTSSSTNLAAASSVAIHDNVIDSSTSQIAVGNADMQNNVNNGTVMVNTFTNNYSIGLTPGAAPANGLYSPSANVVALASNSNQSLTVDDTGRLITGATSAPAWASQYRVIIGSASGSNNSVLAFNDGSQNLNIVLAQTSKTTKALSCDAANDRFYAYSNFDTSTGVYLAAGGTSWIATSDERLKENLVPIENGLDKLSSLRAVVGNYANDDSKTRHPFLLAQDVQAILPEAVDGTNPDELGLSYTSVIPLLVSALKESKERIETLEAKIAALEGA